MTLDLINAYNIDIWQIGETLVSHSVNNMDLRDASASKKLAILFSIIDLYMWEHADVKIAIQMNWICLVLAVNMTIMFKKPCWERNKKSMEFWYKYVLFSFIGF